jgi:chromosome partitioning protein
MVISIVNKKGGTGKTTTAINIGKALTLKSKSVLLIDLDAQGNLSFSLGLSSDSCHLGEVLLAGEITDEHLFEREGMHVVTSTNDLVNYEFDFIQQKYPLTLVKKTIDTVKNNYDYVLIDCPPSAGFLTVNALIASDSVIIPMQLDVLSMQGLEQMLDTVNEIKEEYNNSLSVLGVLGVLVDTRRHLTYEILQHVRDNYGVNIFNNFIRQNVKAAEAPSYGVSVIEYTPKCNSAVDYVNVTNELLMILEN